MLYPLSYGRVEIANCLVYRHFTRPWWRRRPVHAQRGSGAASDCAPVCAASGLAHVTSPVPFFPDASASGLSVLATQAWPRYSRPQLTELPTPFARASALGLVSEGRALFLHRPLSGGSSWTNNRETQRRLSSCSTSSCTAHGAGAQSLRFACGSRPLDRIGCRRSSTGNGAALFVESGRRLAGCRRPPVPTAAFLNVARRKSAPHAVSQRRSVGPDPGFESVQGTGSP